MGTEGFEPPSTGLEPVALPDYAKPPCIRKIVWIYLKSIAYVFL